MIGKVKLGKDSKHIQSHNSEHAVLVILVDTVWLCVEFSERTFGIKRYTKYR